MDNRNLYSYLTQYGTQFPLHLEMQSQMFIDWTEANFTYKQYNPRKKINRLGLSLTSLDGGVSGIPDLDSIPEYNKENNTQLRETDFSVKTPVFTAELQHKMAGFEPYIFRSHILKLNPGGFFPPHRDQITELNSFRIIIPLKNSVINGVYFLSENRILSWEEGRFYFLDTVKSHCLFNASSKSCYWLVFNIGLNQKTFDEIINLIYQ